MEWKLIDTYKRGEVLLFFPAERMDERNYLPKIIRVGCGKRWGYRSASHWADLPPDPVTITVED